MAHMEKCVKRFKMVVQYDGTDYAGWQVQPRHATVQQVIEKAIFQITGMPAKIHGSGRTDQGVHAMRQVAHFDLVLSLPLLAFNKALNAILPPDIRITQIRKATPGFHARRSAVSKEYRYYIWNADTMPPFLRYYRTHVRRPLDIAAMNHAAHLLQGQHDFSAFSANPSREIESTVRCLTKLQVRQRNREIVVIARGDGFLYKMVRSLCGFLIRVGEGAISPDQATIILESKIRTARVPTAPPEGLFLWNVWY